MGQQQDQPKPPRKVFRVRSYEPKDHAAVVDIFTASIHQYPENAEQVQPHWQKLIDDSVQGDLADIHGSYFADGGHYWVATCEGESGTEEVVGMVALKAERGSRGAELRRMSVHPSYHRCGIGRLLVSSLEQWAAAQGYQRVWLGTGKPVVDAQRFYESIGYKCFDSKMLPVGVEILFYEKRLQ